jgi:integrase
MATISKRSRTNKDGQSVEFYEARVNRGGGIALSKSFPSKKEAASWAREIESQIDKGRKTFALKAEKISVYDALADYAKEKDLEGKDLHIVQQVAHDLREKKVGSLTHKTLEEWMETLAKTPISQPENRKKFHPLYNGKSRAAKCYAPGSIRKFYFVLKKGLEWHARENNYLLPQFLFDVDDLPSAWDKPRERRLEAGEWEKLQEAAKTGRENRELWPHVLIILVETGCRVGELVKAKVEHVSIENRSWHVPPESAKTKSSVREIPLSLVAIESFETLMSGKKEEDLVLGGRWRDSNSIGHSFKWLCHRAKIDGLHVHDLRHEALSRLTEKNKLNIIQIMSMSGHSDPRTLARYNKLRPHDIAKLLD